MPAEVRSGRLAGEASFAPTRSHRELIAWQLARESTLNVHRYADRNWTPGRAAAIEQLRRAALSVQLNIAEGHASGPGARCKYHLRIAHGSAVETTEILCLLRDLGGDLTLLIELSIRVQALTFRLWRTSRS